jgi:hypothetical protein
MMCHEFPRGDRKASYFLAICLKPWVILQVKSWDDGDTVKTGSLLPGEGSAWDLKPRSFADL